MRQKHMRDNTLWRKYRIRQAQYDEMLAAQNGLCAICKDPQRSATDKWLVVDHCHTTKRVRSLLCRMCNTGIGYLGEDPSIARAAHEYIIASYIQLPREQQ